MFKAYYMFFIAGVGFFLLGSLVTRAMHDIEEIKFFRYIMAGAIIIIFTKIGIQEVLKDKK